MPLNVTKQFDAAELRFNPPRFSEDILRNFLRDQYGIQGKFKSLAGERDQNIWVTAEDGKKYVYKISSPDELDVIVDFQIKALLHLEEKDPGLSVPRQLRDKAGQPSSVLNDENGRPHCVRLLSFVDGEPLSGHDHLPNDAIKEVGRITGRLCAGLSDFNHPAASHFMPWDTLNGLIFSNDLRENYLPDDFKELAEKHLRHLLTHGVPKLLTLPHQVIHNDGHSGNVMCALNNPAQITGVIDFGDMIARPIIVDVAVSLISMLSHNPDVLNTTSAMLEGYGEYVTIPDEQIALLYDALAAVSILTVQLLSYRAVHHAHDKQKLDEEDLEGAIDVAKTFLSFDRDIFTNQFISRR